MNFKFRKTLTLRLKHNYPPQPDSRTESHSPHSLAHHHLDLRHGAERKRTRPGRWGPGAPSGWNGEEGSRVQSNFTRSAQEHRRLHSRRPAARIFGWVGTRDVRSSKFWYGPLNVLGFVKFIGLWYNEYRDYQIDTVWNSVRSVW